MIRGIDHTSFTVSAMERTIAFYRDIFGMKVLWESLQAGVEYKGPICDKITGCPGTDQQVVFVTVGNSKIEFVQYKPPGKPLVDNKASDTGSAHVCFHTENMMGLSHKFLANGARAHCDRQIRETRK